MFDYNCLLQKYEDMVLYSVLIPCEFILEFAIDVGKTMCISVDKEIIKQACENDAVIGESRICYFEGLEDKRKFIFLDCKNTDYLYTLVVRCSENCCDEVRGVLLKWDKLARMEYHQPISDDLPDWMHCTKYKPEYNPLLNVLKANKLI